MKSIAERRIDDKGKKREPGRRPASLQTVRLFICTLAVPAFAFGHHGRGWINALNGAVA